MSEKKYKWHLVAESESALDFAGNGIAVVEVKGKKICITKQQETFYGFAFKCPHAGGFMADGYIDAVGNVVCPLHRYKFSLKNGRNTSGEGYYLKTYPINTTPEGIFLGIEEGGLFGWIG